MQIIKYPPRETWRQILARPAYETEQLFDTVREVINDVKNRGDEALAEYSEKFDKIKPATFEVSEEEIAQAENEISEPLKQAMETARRNIFKFHAAQKLDYKQVETSPGVFCRQKAVAIQKVGLYIPGGSAPLFSTVLMLAIPAQIAECKEIIICTPPDVNGKIHPAILYAAKISGVSRIFRAGGIQAVAAMAYGTQSIPKVYKIFGPGNRYVTAAKQLVSMAGMAVDLPAGPSEVAIIADFTAKPAFVAADMLSQAEHGDDSQAVLITCCESLAEQVVEETELQLNSLPRRETALKSLVNSKIIVVKTIEEAIELTNEYAPEHLIISTENPEKTADNIENAGSVFLGNYTPESAGDYASGTNHTLPTNGFAKQYSGVNLDSFLKKITIQHITEQGLANIGNAIILMAENEKLQAHANAVKIRLD